MVESRLSRRNLLIATGAAGGLAALSPLGLSLAQASSGWNACLRKVEDRGTPSTAFLNELLTWGKTAPEWIFAKDAGNDVFGVLAPVLGPWDSRDFIGHRRAAMLEALRVLAGCESSWRWTEGKDRNNKSTDPRTFEAGIFQASYDSLFINNASPLREYAKTVGADAGPSKFQQITKSNHQFAIGYTARLISITRTQNSPLLDGLVKRNVSKAAVAEFRSKLKGAPAPTTSKQPSSTAGLPNLHPNSNGGKAAHALKDWLKHWYLDTSTPLGAACRKINVDGGWIGADTWLAMQQFCRTFDVLQNDEKLKTWGPKCWKAAEDHGFDRVRWGA